MKAKKNLILFKDQGVYLLEVRDMQAKMCLLLD